GAQLSGEGVAPSRMVFRVERYRADRRALMNDLHDYVRSLRASTNTGDPIVGECLFERREQIDLRRFAELVRRLRLQPALHVGKLLFEAQFLGEPDGLF